MKTIKQDELTSQIKLFFYNGVDLNRAFMNNVQVFQKYLVDVCFSNLSTDGTKYIFKEGVFGTVDKTMLVGTGLIIEEFSCTVAGDWIFAFGANGDEKIVNADYINVVGDQAFTPPIFSWDSINNYYIAHDVDFAKLIIDEIIAGGPLVTKFCINVNGLPEDILKYDFAIIKTGKRP